MAATFEHANITVRDIHAALRFLQAALPKWQVRYEGEGERGPWLHFGDDETYIDLDTAVEATEGGRKPYHHTGCNHIGFVVDDLSALRERLKAAGYEEGMLALDHPHRLRAYFYDEDGIEWEFIEYLSNNPSERNDYTF